MSLRRQLTLFITFIIVAILAANVVLTLRQYVHLASEALDARMTTISSTVSSAILPVLIVDQDVSSNRAEIASLLEHVASRQADVRGIIISGQEHQQLMAYVPKNLAPPEGILDRRSAPISTRGGTAYGYVTVIFDLADYEKEFRAFLLKMIGIGIVFALFGIVAAYYVAGKITKPIERLRDGAISFGQERYYTRVEVEEQNEIGTLAETFNKMASRIERQMSRLRLLQDRSREIAAELDLDAALKKAVHAFTELGGVSKMSIMLLNDAKAQLEIVEGVGLHPDAKDTVCFNIGEGIAGKVAETGKPIRIEGKLTSQDEYHSYSGDRSRGGALLAMPMISKGKCIGVINLHEKRDGTSFDDSDQTFLSTLSDVVAVAIENARLYDLAITDGLTRLFIRRYFMQRMDEEMIRTHRTAQPLTLLMVDIDRFKGINDTYGHQTGDAVLIELAKVMKRVFREVDILCRYGGEEFALILPNTDRPGSYVAAERFRAAVEEHNFNTPTGIKKITVSGGMSTYEQGVTMMDMISDADKALYESKRTGRNRMTHFQDMG